MISDCINDNPPPVQPLPRLVNCVGHAHVLWVSAPIVVVPAATGDPILLADSLIDWSVNESGANEAEEPVGGQSLLGHSPHALPSALVVTRMSGLRRPDISDGTVLLAGRR